MSITTSMKVAGCLLVLLTLQQGAWGRSRIIGGFDAYQGQFPYMALIKNNSAFNCGGSLVHEYFVLTASHCIGHNNLAEYRVVLGEHTRSTSEGNEQEFSIDLVSRNPSSDVALVRLSARATINHFVQTVELSTTDPVEGKVLDAAGWGWTQSHIFSPADILQTISLPRASKEECDVQLTHPQLPGGPQPPLQSNEICLGDNTLTEYNNICHGDSGGPVVEVSMGSMNMNAGVLRQVGIVTRGTYDCPSQALFSVSASVASVKPWISDTIAQHAPAPPPPPPPPPPPSSSSSGCFPSSSMVETPEGKVPMEMIQHGDKILAMNSNNQLVYSDVIMFLHREPSSHTEYYTIRTEETTLHVSGHHLVRVASESMEQDTYKYAKDVTFSDKLLVVNGTKYELSHVIGIDKGTENGLYAPLTAEGTVVADGVVASCYASVWSHEIAHFSMAPVRAWYQIFGFTTMSDSPTEGIPWYPNLLLQYAQPLVNKYGQIFYNTN